jgi:hypothetical protein
MILPLGVTEDDLANEYRIEHLTLLHSVCMSRLFPFDLTTSDGEGARQEQSIAEFLFFKNANLVS